MKRCLLLFLCVGLPLANVTLADEPQPAGQLAIISDFPGGSAIVEEIDQDRRLIRVRPSEHKERGWVCWWSFKATGIKPGETLTLDVGGGVWATPDRAAFSTDNKTWVHTAPGTRDKDRIVYTQKVEGTEAWFAWGPPFVPEDAAELVERIARQSPHAEAFELCKTRAGRSTPALRVSQEGAADTERFGLWIQARQHAWESGSSWVCRGLTEWLVSDDPRAESLRKKAHITIVPIMDIDNAAIGAGGKNQVPQDHNRDWSDEPYWRSVAAAQHEIRAMDQNGRFDLFVDLHNPDAGSKNPFYFVAPKELLAEIGQRNLQRLVDATKEEMTGPLKYLGATRESGAKYDKAWKAISKNWVTVNCRKHVVAVTLETAWNTPHSTAEGYQQVGRELGLAIERYLRDAEREPADAPQDK